MLQVLFTQGGHSYRKVNPGIGSAKSWEFHKKLREGQSYVLQLLLSCKMALELHYLGQAIVFLPQTAYTFCSGVPGGGVILGSLGMGKEGVQMSFT